MTRYSQLHASAIRCAITFLALAILPPFDNACSAFDVNVSGNLQWRDGQDNLHNARGVKVEVWSIDFFGNHTIEFTTNADLEGN